MVYFIQAGGVAEWLKAAVLKTVVSIFRDREFEPHPHRYINFIINSDFVSQIRRWIPNARSYNF